MRSRCRPGDDGATSWPEGRRCSQVLMVSRPSHVRREPHDLTDGELAGQVYQLARCAGSRVDPDDWFPEARGVAKARDQAARAIAVCARCPVRPDCLELSMRYAFGIGAYGVWGGLVEEERAGGPPPVADRDQRHRIPPGPARTVTERPTDGSPPWPPRAPPRPPPWPR